MNENPGSKSEVVMLINGDVIAVNDGARADIYDLVILSDPALIEGLVSCLSHFTGSHVFRSELQVSHPLILKNTLDEKLTVSRCLYQLLLGCAVWRTLDEMVYIGVSAPLVVFLSLANLQSAISNSLLDPF